MSGCPDDGIVDIDTVRSLGGPRGPALLRPAVLQRTRLRLRRPHRPRPRRPGDLRRRADPRAALAHRRRRRRRVVHGLARPGRPAPGRGRSTPGRPATTTPPRRCTSRPSEFYDQSLAFVDGMPDTSVLVPTFRDHRARLGRLRRHLRRPPPAGRDPVRGRHHARLPVPSGRERRGPTDPRRHQRQRRCSLCASGRPRSSRRWTGGGTRSCFDGPGQQSMLFERDIPFRHDWEAVLTPVVDVLVDRDDVDTDALLAYAISQGGYGCRGLSRSSTASSRRWPTAAWSTSPGPGTSNIPPELLALLRAGDRDRFNAAISSGPSDPERSASSPSAPSLRRCDAVRHLRRGAALHAGRRWSTPSRPRCRSSTPRTSSSSPGSLRSCTTGCPVRRRSSGSPGGRARTSTASRWPGVSRTRDVRLPRRPPDRSAREHRLTPGGTGPVPEIGSGPADRRARRVAAWDRREPSSVPARSTPSSPSSAAPQVSCTPCCSPGPPGSASRRSSTSWPAGWTTTS